MAQLGSGRFPAGELVRAKAAEVSKGEIMQS